MIAVAQRVLEARVSVNARTVGEIGPGMVVFAAVEKADTPADVDWLASKLAGLRIFRSADRARHFDLDITQAGGAMLLVSNFTLAAETRKGRRPSLEAAAEPELARALFARLVDAVRAQNIPTATGEFAADMQVLLTNDGPATFLIRRP